MSTLIRTAFVALVLASASGAMAQDSGWTDKSKPHGGYAPNSQEGNRAFWDYQGQQGN